MYEEATTLMYLYNKEMYSYYHGLHALKLFEKPKLHIDIHADIAACLLQSCCAVVNISLLSDVDCKAIIP